MSAATDVVRELRSKGLMPILKQPLGCVEDAKLREVHIPVHKKSADILAETVKAEGGSRAKLTGELLLTVHTAINGSTHSLTHEGLVAEIRKLFL